MTPETSVDDLPRDLPGELSHGFDDLRGGRVFSTLGDRDTKVQEVADHRSSEAHVHDGSSSVWGRQPILARSGPASVLGPGRRRRRRSEVWLGDLGGDPLWGLRPQRIWANAAELYSTRVPHDNKSYNLYLTPLCAIRYLECAIPYYSTPLHRYVRPFIRRIVDSLTAFIRNINKAAYLDKAHYEIYSGHTCRLLRETMDRWLHTKDLVC